MTGTRALRLLNPKARRGRDTGANAADQLRKLGLNLEVIKIRDPGGFPELLRRRAPDVDQVVVAGGDGTLNAVVQGLAETGTPLGIIPVRAVQIVVGNGRYYGSALPVAEDGEIDGELGPNTPATVIVVPRALAVLCP